MKLLKLKLKNIASYQGEHEIDFTVTNIHNLFAITGETGAGKSTILNSISLSLFGKTYKPLNQIDFVTMGMKDGLIQLSLQVNYFMYEVYLYIKVRKENNELLKKPIIDRSFYQIDNIGNKTKLEHCDGEVILGLSFEQFLKTTVLNQGQFAKFLLSNFPERKKILSDLYQGDKLDLINENSKYFFNFYKKELEIAEREFAHLQSMNNFDTAILASEIENKKNELENISTKLQSYSEQTKFVFTTQNLMKQNSELQSKTQNLESELSQHTAEYNKFKIDFNVFEQEYLTQKNNLSSQIKELEVALLTQEEQEKSQQKAKILTDQRLKIEEENTVLYQKLQTIQLNLNIKKQSRPWDSILEKLKDNEVIQLRNDLPILDNKFSMDQVFNQTVQDIHVKIKNTDNQLENLQLIEEITYLHQKNELTEKKQSLFIQIKQFEANKQTQNDKTKKHLHLITENKILEQKNETFIYDIKELETLIFTIEKYNNENSKILVINQLIEKSNSLNSCELCHEPLNKKLSPIVPIDALPIKKPLEILKAELKVLQNDFAVIQSSYHLNKSQISSLEDELRTLSHLNQFSIDETKIQIDKINLELEAIDNKLKENLRSKHLIQTLNKTKAELLDELEIKKGLNKNNKEELNTLINQTKKLLSEDINQENLSILIESVNSFLERKNLINELSLVQSLIKRNLESIYDLNIQTNIEVEKINELKAKLNAFINELSFNDQYKLKQNELTTLEDKNTSYLKKIQNLEKILNEQMTSLNIFKTELKSNENEIKRVLENWKKSLSFPLLFKDKELILETISLQALSHISNQLELEIKSHTDNSFEVSKRLGSLNNDYMKAQELQISVKNKKENLDKIKSQFSLYKELFELVGREEFKNFVLSFLENLIIDYTNKELNQLCNGRYQLLLNSNDNEIFVIDSFQDYSMRKVQTLSGGETFLISLAMSLGLSEISRNNISIESFFIDEGFGQLDDESLEEVINLLYSLSAQGKFIGIISHIKKLTDRIPANLHIQKGDKGYSEARWIMN
jgi:exonuclease SbcC